MQPLQIGQNVRSYLNKRVSIKIVDPKNLKSNIFPIFQILNWSQKRLYSSIDNQASLNVSVPNEGLKCYFWKLSMK